MKTATTVPLLDLYPTFEPIRQEIEAAIGEVVDSQYFVLGPKVTSFEAALAEYLGVGQVVGCTSGSDAILLALMALDIRPGDQVICPSFTFFATAGSICRLGASPVFVDIDPVTFNMCPTATRRAIEQCSTPAAIMPVHLYGQAAAVDDFMQLGDEFGVAVIEDCAQAIGARDATGAVVGTRSRIGCLSFFPTKNLGCFGDGGAIMSNDQDLANRISRLRVHGMEPKYVHAEVGINGRLDALQAAVLEVKLKYLEQWHQNRADNAARYTALFSEAGASIGAGNAHQSNLPLDIPAPPDGPARHVWNQFVIRVPAALRESLRAHLAENDIGSEVYYQIPLHMQACFAEQFVEQPLPETERACEEVLALPVFPGLTASQIETTASTVINWLRGH